MPIALAPAQAAYRTSAGAVAVGRGPWHVADRVPVLVVVVGKGPSRGKKRSDGARGEEPERPAAADGAFSQSSSQLVEGAVGRLLAHLCPPILKGGTLLVEAPPR